MSIGDIAMRSCWSKPCGSRSWCGASPCTVVQDNAFAVDGACVEGERQSPYGQLTFHDAETR
jgi:hypothetical protein